MSSVCTIVRIKCLIAKQSEERFQLTYKEKMCFLRVTAKEKGHDYCFLFVVFAAHNVIYYFNVTNP